jgi:hypothetical protein
MPFSIENGFLIASGTAVEQASKLDEIARAS